MFPDEKHMNELNGLNETQLVILYTLAITPKLSPMEIVIPNIAQGTIRVNLMKLLEAGDVEADDARYFTKHHVLEILEAYLGKRLNG